MPCRYCCINDDDDDAIVNCFTFWSDHSKALHDVLNLLQLRNGDGIKRMSVVQMQATMHERNLHIWRGMSSRGPNRWTVRGPMRRADDDDDDDDCSSLNNNESDDASAVHRLRNLLSVWKRDGLGRMPGMQMQGTVHERHVSRWDGLSIRRFNRTTDDFRSAMRRAKYNSCYHSVAYYNDNCSR